MDYVPRSVSIIDFANMNCDRTQISGLAARAHNYNALARIGGCGHASGTKRGEKSKSRPYQAHGQTTRTHTQALSRHTSSRNEPYNALQHFLDCTPPPRTVYRADS